MKETVRRYLEQKARDNTFNSHNEDKSSSRGSSLEKETQEEILMERKRAKTENIEIVLNGPRKASVCEEIRAASSTI